MCARHVADGRSEDVRLQDIPTITCIGARRGLGSTLESGHTFPRMATASAMDASDGITTMSPVGGSSNKDNGNPLNSSLHGPSEPDLLSSAMVY